MNYNAIRKADQESRDQMLKEELGPEKTVIIEKFGLRCNAGLDWEKYHTDYPTQVWFSHKFAKRNSPLRIIFRIYRLCFAKVKYFDANWDKYTPCMHDWQQGFKETDISNMEFMRHDPSGIVLDMRTFEKITDINDFRAMCAYLESLETKEKNQ
ncbi:MAG: hypothetical protein GY754_06200 [bacterium]|nr:hypothetical protein [bacterium]